MNASTRTILIAVAASIATAFPALAAPSSTRHPATSATLRDAVADVLLSDGNTTYADREVISRITDFVDPTSPDQFAFQPGNKRGVRINNVHVGGDAPVACGFSFTTFRSSTVPNWYNVTAIGSSVPSDASFICFEDSGLGLGRQWRVRYPDFPSECALIERVDAATWRFTVPEGCLATVTTSVKERGQTTETVANGVTAPMQITAVIP